MILDWVLMKVMMNRTMKKDSDTVKDCIYKMVFLMKKVQLSMPWESSQQLVLNNLNRIFRKHFQL
jgi:hypothetical protein